jgi:tRNA nucleotidyltransferase (CCA-adding enzyme)
MASKLEAIFSQVSRKSTPSPEEKIRVAALAEKVKNKVEKIARKKKLDMKVRVEGSVAKDTWLKESPDIDIFMRIPSTVPQRAFGTIYLEIAKEATAGAKQVERFADHPYLEAVLDKTIINIVPCYDVEKGEWKSATDRTPFHTDYVQPLLNDKLCGEIRLLKQFMKGINIYGAEIKIGGFSGYLCELLVLSFGSFLEALKAASSWKARTIIDFERHYKGQESKLKLAFEEPLVIIDPVDKGRNAASAVRQDQLDQFVAASREFLSKPRKEFFYPPETKPFIQQELLEKMENRASTLVFIEINEVKAVPDVLWGQLYKSQRALQKFARRHEFEIVGDAVWSDEKALAVFVLEAKHRYLPHLKGHTGPPLHREQECEKFLRKHKNSRRTLSGPRIERGRWVVDIFREHSDLVELLESSLKKGGKEVGLAELVSKAMAKTLKILVNEEVLAMYRRNQSFARFLTEYLRGKPKWLA